MDFDNNIRSRYTWTHLQSQRLATNGGKWNWLIYTIYLFLQRLPITLLLYTYFNICNLDNLVLGEA